MKPDIDSILKIFTDYEARKEAAREWELKNFGKVDENHISHLATCAKGEAEKAFEAVKVLVEYARELEEYRERLNCEAAYLARAYPVLDCRVCDYSMFCPRNETRIEPDFDLCKAAILNSCKPDSEEAING